MMAWPATKNTRRPAGCAPFEVTRPISTANTQANSANPADRPLREANQPRKHHYVPIFYQELFANASGLLWLYDRKLQTYRQLRPAVICVEKDLYTLKPDDAPRDRRMESHYLSFIDSLGASAIRDVQTGRSLHATSIGALSLFTAHQFTRLPSTAKAVSAMYAAAGTEAARQMFANVERAEQVLKKYADETGKPIDVSPESMVEFVHGNHMKVSATEIAFLKSIIRQAASLSHLIKNLDWQILEADAATGFIICDSPVVVVPPKSIAAVGFAVPGSVKYFPLTRRLCLRLGDFGSGVAVRAIDRETVRIINQNIAANSERFIMGPDRAQLEILVGRSGSTELDATPRFTVETVERDESGALQKITFHPRRYFYPKNGSPQAP